MQEFLPKYGVVVESEMGVKRYLDFRKGLPIFTPKVEDASKFNMFDAKELAKKYRAKVTYFAESRS